MWPLTHIWSMTSFLCMFLLSSQTFHLQSFPYAWSTLLRIFRGSEFLKFLLSVKKDLEKYFSKVGSYFLQHTKHSIVPTLLKSPLWAYYSFKSNEAICLLSLAAFETFIEFSKSVNGYPSEILEISQPFSSNIVSI